MYSRFALAVVSFLLVLGAGSAAAQAAPNISSACQSALLGLASSSEAACLNVAGLAGLLIAPANSSIIEPLNSWAAGACAQEPCSNQAITDIFANVTTGCSSDLSALGMTSSTGSLTGIVTVVQQLLPTIKSISCLKTTSNDTLCATSLLEDIESTTGMTLSLSNLMSLMSANTTGTTGTTGIPTNIPASIACSDCAKEAFNILSQNVALATLPPVKSALSSMCGANFVDGSDVSNVVEGTGSAAPSSTAGLSSSGAAPTGTGVAAASGAVSLLSRGVLTSIALSFVFLILS